MSDAAENIQFDDSPGGETPVDVAPAADPSPEPTPAPVEPAQPAAAADPAPDPAPAADPAATPPADPANDPSKPTAPVFSPEQQAYINEHIVGRFRARLGDAEDRATGFQTQLQEMQQQANPQAELPDDGPVVPPIPENYWEESYAADVKARDEAIAARAKWEADQQVQVQQQQQAELQAAEQYKQHLNNLSAQYLDRAKKLGIPDTELQFANTQINNIGMAEDVRVFIAMDEQGPEITRYLGANMAEVSAMAQMSPMQAAEHITTSIKPAIAAAKQAVQDPPPPVESPKGSGIAPKEHRDGHHFE